jgi:phage tail P2-like protein
MSNSSKLSQLLPPNTTILERAATQALGNFNETIIPIRSLGSATQCPLSLLPYLAWSRSVDRWDVDWPEQTKRAVTQDAFFVHQRKGTIGALRRVVAPFGFLLNIKEWWQFNPHAQPGTFSLNIGVLESGITEEAYHELVRLIEDAKPLSRHLVGLAIVVATSGKIPVNLICHDGHTITVYPPAEGIINIMIPIVTQGCPLMIDTLQIFYYV